MSKTDCEAPNQVEKAEKKKQRSRDERITLLGEKEVWKISHQKADV